MGLGKCFGRSSLAACRETHVESINLLLKVAREKKEIVKISLKSHYIGELDKGD